MTDTWTQLAPGSRVVVAMSGGVDSSVAAALLVERGCDVIGITMKNFCYSEVPEEYAAASCCSLEAIDDARAVARRLGFPHHVLDFEGPFRDAVMDPFVAEYAAGRTPNPCVRCNRYVRFPQLWRKARALGAVAVATGHYARAVRSGDASQETVAPVELWRAADRAKDQTFYLWGLTPALLAHAVFPLGGLEKPAVRDRARALGLATAERPESQDICFIPDGDLAGFLTRYQAAHPEVASAARFTPGPIQSTAGATVGTHPGSGFFTVGQRRGLGLAGGGAEPLYVTAIAEDNVVQVGPEADLYADGLFAEDVNWLTSPDDPFRAAAQFRYRQTAQPATITPGAGRTARVAFDAPQRAIAPGQAIVFYAGDRVLGGGTIAAAVTAA